MAITNNNVTFKTLVSAIYRADNSQDTTGNYTISADIQVGAGAVTAVSNGTITHRINGGSGSFWADANNSHYDFYGMSDSDAQVAAIQAIRAFIDGAASSIPTDPTSLCAN